MSDVQVRKAKAADIPTLTKLKRDVSTRLLTRLGHTPEQIADWHARMLTDEYFAGYVRLPRALYLVEQDGEAVGMAGFDLQTEENSCYFSNLYCLNSGDGHGSRLMEHRLGVAEHFNVEYIESRVHGMNVRAQRFVQHYGFHPVHELSYTEPSLGSRHLVFRKEVT